jgi:Fic family protein
MKNFKNKLKKIDKLHQKYLQKRPLDESEAQARFEKLRLEWTYHSNAIEGNSLTLGETAFYLREGLTSEGKPLADYLEAKNHTEAIDWLFEVAEKERQISESFIKELNALLHKGITERPAITPGGQKITRPIHPGEYKKTPNHVLTLSGEIHNYVEPVKVPQEMQKLVKEIREKQSKTHPVELAAFTHYHITRIHPFDDCNGRVARLLLNLILIKKKYPPIVIKNEERREYIKALEKADQGEKQIFYNFVADHVIKSLQ